jgi:hypothetical protein
MQQSTKHVIVKSIAVTRRNKRDQKGISKVAYAGQFLSHVDNSVKAIDVVTRRATTIFQSPLVAPLAATIDNNVQDHGIIQPIDLSKGVKLLFSQRQLLPETPEPLIFPWIEAKFAIMTKRQTRRTHYVMSVAINPVTETMLCSIERCLNLHYFDMKC